MLEALEAAASAQGFDLVDIEQTGSGRNALLRVYINKDEGLNLDEVASANAWVAKVVEELDPYKGSYTLEVSSPGIDKPLRTLAHFEKAVGEEAVITLESAQAVQGETHKDTQDASPKAQANNSKPRLKYTGKLVAVDQEKQLISLEAEGVAHQLPYGQIKKARTKGRLDFEGRKDS